ncbi:MAG: hypothetical protein J6Z80_01845, partial [Clostridia bacterium]|nr:hypothetical protein [Clostridia bacterium]
MKNKSKTAFFVKAICLILAVADFLPLLFSCDVDPDITEPLSEKVSDTGQTPETESGATMTSDVEIPDIDTDGLEFTMHDDDHKFLGYGYDEKKVYPADMFSAAPTESRSYFETKNGVGISQDPAYMKENYAYNTVELIKDGDGYKTLWKFKTRNFGVLPELTIDMGCNYFIFDSVSFTVENKSDGMLKFSMKTSEVNAQPVSNPKTGTFSAISSGYVQGNETKKVFLDFTQSFSKYELLPVTTGSIYVSPVGVVQDKAYEIVLSGFSISFKQNAEVTGCAVKLLESSARPGDTVRLAIGATGVKPSDDVTVEFVRNEEYCFRVRLTDAEKKTLSSSGVLGITTVIPSHASTGDYKAVAVVNGYRVKDSVPGEISVSNDGPFDFPKMEVVKENGVPAIRKNGEPFLWDGVANGTLTPGIAYEFGENGSTVYMFEASLSSHNYGHSAQPTWLGPDKWDYSAIEELACAVMEADENAHLVIRLYFSLPAFWLLDNPDEAVLGTSDGKNYFRDVEYIGNEAVSLASKKWLDEEIRQLGLFMDYVKTRPWAERLIGIYLGGAVTTEWFAFFHNTNGVWGDYSEVNRQAFEDWGKTDNGKLLASLDPKTVTVPTPAQRIGGPYSIKPDTADSLLSAAYSQY